MGVAHYYLTPQYTEWVYQTAMRKSKQNVGLVKTLMDRWSKWFRNQNERAQNTRRVRDIGAKL